MKYLNIVLSLFILTSCYKDLGNYDYNDNITDISVALDKEYIIKKSKEDWTYTIKPEIGDVTGQHHLGFAWFLSKDKRYKGDEVGKEKEVTLTFKPKSQDPKDRLANTYFLRLYVTDSTTNTVTMRYTTLSLQDPYYGAFMVLHNDAGHAELGTIEFLSGKTVITPNAYTKENGSSLVGLPMYMGVRQIPNSYAAASWLYSINSQLFVSTSDINEAGLISPGDNFAVKNKWTSLISQAEKQDYIPSKISGCGGGDPGYAFSCNGKIFMNNTYSPVFYELHQDTEAIKGESKITKMAVGANTGLAYDEQNHSLVGFAINQGRWTETAAKANPTVDLVYEPIRQSPQNAADPNQLPVGAKCVDIFSGYKYSQGNPAPWFKYQLYAYFIDNNKSYVYTIRGLELASNQEAPISGYYTFNKPQGIEENTIFTSGKSFANIVFYASGNKVYKHNIANGTSSVIYTLEDQGATAVCSKMAVESYFDDKTYKKFQEVLNFPPERTLAVAFNTPQGGVVVVLHLDTSGDVATEKNIYNNIMVCRGFGPIKSVVFA